MASFIDRVRKALPGADAPPPSDALIEAPEQQQVVIRRPLPHPGQLRRERRALLRAREERIRDLGGVVLEMYRRDRFREDLIFEQAGELVSLEERLHEVDQLLAATISTRHAPAMRCACGAPLLYGSHFCSNCGRPAGEQAVVACASCGNPLAADTQFCARCGAPAGSVNGEAPAAGIEQPATESGGGEPAER